MFVCMDVCMYAYVICIIGQWCINLYNLNCSRLVKSHCNSIRCSFYKICSLTNRHETKQEISKSITFVEVTNKSIIYKFLKVFLAHKRRLARQLFLTVDLPALFLNTRTTNVTFQFLCIEEFYWSLNYTSLLKSCFLIPCVVALGSLTSKERTFFEKQSLKWEAVKTKLCYFCKSTFGVFQWQRGGQINISEEYPNMI